MSYLDGDRYLDGPMLADWLEPVLEWEARGLQRPFPTWVPNLRRRLLAWRQGEHADLYQIESYLLHLGILAIEVPDFLWVKDSPKSVGQKRYRETLAA